MSLPCLLLLLATVAPATPALPAPPPPSHELVVRQFVASFNAQDAPGMLLHVTPTVEWANLDRRALALETEGAVALGTAMKSYFASCPSCRSRLDAVLVAGSRVATWEAATWTTPRGEATARSLAVYEFEDGRIARVVYFPAERAAAPPAPETTPPGQAGPR